MRYFIFETGQQKAKISPDNICNSLHGFTPCKAEQPLEDIELQKKGAQKDKSMQEIALERRIKRTNYLSLFDHFVWLMLKGLN